MKRSLLEIYALVICVFTLIVFTISVGMTIKQVITVMYPEFMVVDYQPYGSDPYGHKEERTEAKDSVQLAKSPEQLEQEEEAKMRKDRKKTVASEVKRAKRDIVDSAIFMVISVILYGIHWRLAKRERRRRQEAVEKG